MKQGGIGVVAGQGERMRQLRADLGPLWGINRPVTASELGRALRMGRSEPAKQVKKWESEKGGIPGPAMVAMELFSLGNLPPDGLAAVLHPRRRS